MAFKNSLDLAEITNTKGHIGNPAPTGVVVVPRNIDLDRPDAIEWSFGDDNKNVRPPDNLIQRFAELHDKQPHVILDFAKRFGVLGLNDGGFIPRESELRSFGTEPIAEWRSFSLRVRSILHLAAALHNKESVKLLDPPRTPLFDGGIPSTRHSRGGGSLALPLREIIQARINDTARRNGRPTSRRENNLIGREILDWMLDAWLDHFPTAISVDRVNGELVLELEYRRGLLSVIALQLLQAIARKSIYLCSECKNFFIRYGGSNLERRPKANLDRFCDQCGKDGTKAALRRADTRRREKQRQAKALYAAGRTVKEIALKLGVAKTSTVSGWVGKRT